MVKYYTGLLSCDLLKAICELVMTDVPTILFSGCSCSPLEQFLIVLMKLRLNIGDQDLAYRFGIHQSTISRYFNKWLDILYHISELAKREELLRIMPVDFRTDFGKYVIIMDCFVIFIERPTSLMARAQTWSNYKKHNIVKFLIGITPQGTVGFISKGWGGRASDVHITEHSGLLHHLLSGDVVLADRGFNIQVCIVLRLRYPLSPRAKSSLARWRLMVPADYLVYGSMWNGSSVWSDGNIQLFNQLSP